MTLSKLVWVKFWEICCWYGRCYNLEV